MRVILIMTFKYAFYKFYRVFKKCKRMSLGSKYDEVNDFYALLNALINTHEETSTEKKIKKIVKIEFNIYKKNYYSEKIKDEKKRRHDYKQFEIIDNKDQEPKSTMKL